MLNNLNPVRNNNSPKNWKKISNRVNIPRVIYLYNEGIKYFNFNGLKNFIKNNFGKIDVKVIRLKKDVVQTKGLILDFLMTKEAFDKISPEDKEACRIILTNKILATYDEDKKLHIPQSNRKGSCPIYWARGLMNWAATKDTPPMHRGGIFFWTA